MATQQEEQDRRNQLVEILARHKKLSAADIQIFREGGIAIPSLSSKHDWFSLRMEIELIDAIRSLDASTSFLSIVGIVVAIIGVLFTLVQVLIAIKVLPLK